jgi:hypothetical protein
MRTFKFVPKACYFVIVLIAVLFFSACKKDVVTPLFEEQQELTTELNQTAKDFFDLNYLINNHGGLAPSSYSRRAPSEVVDLVYNDLLNQELENNFVVDLVDEFGYPAWQNADIIDSTDYAAVYIPFSFTDSEEITAYLSAAINGEAVYYRLVSRALMDSVIEVSNLDHNRGIVVASLFSFTKVNRLAFGTNTKRHLNFIEENVSFNENGYATKIQGISTFGQPRNTTVSWTVCEMGEYARRYWVKYVHHAYTIICSGDSGGGGGSRWGNPWKYTDTVFNPPRGNNGGGNGGGTSTQNQPLTNLQNLLKDCEDGTLSFDPLCTQYNLTIGCLPFLEARQDVLNWYHSEGLFSQLQSFACSAANKRFLESAIVKYYQLKSSNQINGSLEAFSENWYPVWELKEWGINIDQTKELWLLENLDELDAIHEFIHLNGADAEHSSAAEIYMNLASQDLLDIEYGNTGNFESNLNISISDVFQSNGLGELNQLSAVSWYRIFSREFRYQRETLTNPDTDPLLWLRTYIKAKQVWFQIKELGPQLNQAVQELGNIIPSTIDEWYVFASAFGPILIDIGTDFIPIVGEIKAFARTFEALIDNNYGTAGIEFLGGILGIIPVGDVLRAIPKIFIGLKTTFLAFKIFKVIAKSSPRVFTEIKGLLSAGWKFAWEDGVIKLIDEFGVIAARLFSVTRRFADDVTGFIGDIQLSISRILGNTGWKVFPPSRISNSTPIIPTAGSRTYLGVKAVAQNGQRLIPPQGGAIGNLATDIAATGDRLGRKTEEMSDLLYKKIYGCDPCVRSDLHINGNQGFDNVVFLPNGDVIINEAKQMATNGSIKLNPRNPDTGLPSQMSDGWVRDVIDRMRRTNDQNLIAAANQIETAANAGRLQKVVTAVDRTTGEVVITALNNF